MKVLKEPMGSSFTYCKKCLFPEGRHTLQLPSQVWRHNPAAVSMRASLHLYSSQGSTAQSQSEPCPSYWRPAQLNHLRSALPRQGEVEDSRKGPSPTAGLLERALPEALPTLLLTSHWSTLGHMATPNCKEDWEIWSFIWSHYCHNKI